MKATRLLGVVYDPARDELFVGQKEHGATLNRSSIRVSATAQLSKALLVTGFAYDVHTVPDNNLKEFGQFTLRARGHQEDRIGRDRPLLCRLRSIRWILGTQPPSLGHCGRNPHCRRSRRKSHPLWR